jgi:hypothetical protein
MKFSISTLFVLVTLVAVAMYTLVAAPGAIAVPLLVFVNLSVAGALLVCCIHAKGRLRAFFLGALLPAATTVVSMTFLLPMMADPTDFKSLIWDVERHALLCRVWSAASWIMCPLVGILTLGAAKAFSQGRDIQAPDPPPIDRGQP